MFDIIKNLIMAVYNGGSSIFLPIIFAIVGLVFGMKFFDSLKAGLKAGIGLTGVGLVTSYLTSSLSPVMAYYAEKGTGFTIADLPWTSVGALPFTLPFAVFFIPGFAILSIVLVRLKVFKTLHVDIWNYGLSLGVSAFAYVLFDSVLLAVVVAVAHFVFTLWLADRFGERWSESLGMPNTTVSNATQMSIGGSVCWIVNKVFDLIPGLKTLKLEPKQLQKKLGVISEPVFLGLIMGLILGLLTRQNVMSILQIAVGVSGSMVLIPHVLKVFLEGLGAITSAANAWAIKHLGEGSKFYIACDIAMCIGSPVAITVSTILIPVSILIALIIPGFSYFPIGIMVGFIYMAGFCTMYCKEDFLRSLVSSILYVTVFMVIMDLFAPEIGLVFKTLDPSIVGEVTTTQAVDIFSIVLSLVHRVIG